MINHHSHKKIFMDCCSIVVAKLKCYFIMFNKTYILAGDTKAIENWTVTLDVIIMTLYHKCNIM